MNARIIITASRHGASRPAGLIFDTPPSIAIRLQCFRLQCFDTVGWAAGRASGL